MNTSEHSFHSRHKTAIFMALAGVIILLLECFAFNIQFWSTLGASRDSTSALNTLGSGLKRQKNGTLLVTDPTSAFLITQADGSSPYLRLDSAETTFRFTSPSRVQGAASSAGKTGDTDKGRSKFPLTTFQVRVDAAGHASHTRPVSTTVAHSLYLHIPKLDTGSPSTLVKVWIEEPAGTKVDVAAVHANVRVPFHADWGRVAAMAALVLLITAWMPASKLWRIRLDTTSIAQRIAFAVFIVIAAILTAVSITQSIWTNPSAFHEPDNYTYDFNQYGHMADSLIHGRTSIDLPVPQALKTTANPYDPHTREALLEQGVNPIYWDYAFYQNHWYSYFGVLPALLLFVPYRLVTSLFTPGGLMLPAGAAVALLLLVFVIFAALLVIRVLKMVRPNISVAAVSMAITLFVLGSQAGYLAFRLNFYSVPFAASMALSVMGIWFWLGVAGYQRADSSSESAIIRSEHNNLSQPLPQTKGKRRAGRHHMIVIGQAPPISWPHLSAGSLALAANFGCRPTFALVALLAFPIFWPQIREIFRKTPTPVLNPCNGPTKSDKTKQDDSTDRTQKNKTTAANHSGNTPVTDKRNAKRKAVGMVLCSMLLPALVVVVPLCIYNAVRFGSPFNFGERYQITVADMTHYRNTAVNLLPTVGYYLFLPLRFSHEFPFLTINPTPLPSWSYAEPMVGGLFALCPALLVVALLLLPSVRRHIRRSGLLRTILTALPLALLLLLVDSLKGGIGWRYMVDFGWLVALSAVVVLGVILGDARPCRDTGMLSAKMRSHVGTHETSTSLPQPNPRNQFGKLIPHRAATSRSPRSRIDWGLVAIRLVMLLLVLLSIILAFFTMFVPGREDALTRTDPVTFQAVASWFMIG
ncbi:glycosyltransferase [Bifidobacterium sp. ESL0745]|uniref:glycosyltransferase n=1 Tax=Bifidobacterium sp. ESL0745 TaxID=2983226 RepID=UPI0023F8141D|nr:glycosyltransferase [Bifidobacterium sp. ESL0745]MDF7664940.1 glycosyltransferase [Bifidobacterium sp. ESL0745]